MERSYNSADVICPFYRNDDSRQRKIRCEGIVEDSSLTLYFRRKEDYALQLHVFCCDHYDKCECAAMLMEKHGAENRLADACECGVKLRGNPEKARRKKQLRGQMEIDGMEEFG